MTVYTFVDYESYGITASDIDISIKTLIPRKNKHIKNKLKAMKINVLCFKSYHRYHTHKHIEEKLISNCMCDQCNSSSLLKLVIVL